MHRAVAYYNGPTGRAGLYEYCGLQINAIVNSITFAAVPNSAVQKGESFSAAVALSSAIAPAIGPARCRVTLSGGNNAAPAAFYTLGADNAFNLIIHTKK